MFPNVETYSAVLFRSSPHSVIALRQSFEQRKCRTLAIRTIPTNPACFAGQPHRSTPRQECREQRSVWTCPAIYLVPAAFFKSRRPRAVAMCQAIALGVLCPLKDIERYGSLVGDRRLDRLDFPNLLELAQYDPVPAIASWQLRVLVWRCSEAVTTNLWSGTDDSPFAARPSKALLPGSAHSLAKLVP
jgi:hypothetical protein